MDLLQPAWMIISVILGVGVFLGVGVLAFRSGDELVWSVGKALGSFAVCWVVLCQFGALLNAIARKGSEDLELGTDEAGSGDERG